MASSQAAFYAGRVNWIVTPTGAKFVATIKRVSDTASDVQTWTLPDAGIGFSPSDTILTGFCVSWDGQTLYYSAINRDLDPSHDLMRYDLNGSTSLSALATDPTFYPSSSLALSDGSVVSLWGTETTAEIRVYNSSGVLLNARPWVVGAGARFTRGRDDTTVWFWSGSGVVQIRVADLDVLESFPVSDSANAGIALFVTRKDAGNKLLSVSFDNGRNIRVDGDPGEYDAPHWQS